VKDWTLAFPSSGIYQAEALTFGSPRSRYVMTAMPAVDSPEFTTDDTSNVRADGITFGTDALGSTTVSFALETNGVTDDDGVELYEELRRTWRADAVRLDPGKVATLTSHHGRRAFGRPRRISRDARFSHVGRSAVTADFKTVDDLWYGPERSAEVKLIPELGGGLTAPLVAPLTTTASSDRSTYIDVGGKLPTWATIEVYGDIVRPEVEVVGVLRMTWDLALAYDQKLVADARPWVRSILRNGESVAGSVSRDSTSILRLLLPPGRYPLALRGASQSGTARAIVRWSDAFTTY